MFYHAGHFIANEPSRRKLRDAERGRFFAGFGGQRLKDPFAYDPDPAEQLALVQGLIGKAMALHEDDQSALKLLKGQLAGSSLGVSALGGGLTGRPSFEGHSVTAFVKKFFHDAWGNYLGGDEEA